MIRFSAAIATVVLLGALSGVAAQDLQEPKITLDLKDADLRSAVDTLMSQWGKNYVLAPDVPTDARVTMHLADVRAEDALRALLAAHGLTYTVEPGGIYLVRKKSEKRIGENIETVKEPSEPIEIAEGVTVEKIVLMYTDPYEVAAVLTGNGSGNRFDISGLSGLWPNGNDNSLIAKFNGNPYWGSSGQGPGWVPQNPVGPGERPGLYDRGPRVDPRLRAGDAQGPRIPRSPVGPRR